jgi:hypothetical protein
MGEIETTRLVVLGEVDGNEGFVSLPVDVGRRKNGEWVVTDQITAEEVQFFSASGQWLRKIGREGAGPGEFQAAWFVDVVQDDGLLVWDSGLGRITRFDSQLDVIEITPVRFRATSVAFLQSGKIVANAHLNGPLRVGLPLHLVDSVGAIIHSFGAEPPIRNWGNYYQTMRRLAPAGPKAVWSANLTDYSIERWTTLGVKTAHLVREVPWFPSIDDWGAKRNKEDPPEPRIYAIHESEDGLVWVLIHIADEAWEEGYEERLSPWGEMTRIISDDNRVYDSVVEVVDPQSAVVLASARLDAAFRGFAGDGLLFSRVYRDEKFPVLEIWKLHIR